MMPDRHGEMGFMEAVVCTIAVCIILNAFIAFSAADSISENRPLERFEPGSASIGCSDGIRIDEDYLLSYMVSADLYGISVSVTVPFFSEESITICVGEQRGLLFRDTYTIMVDYANGRHVPALMEVSAYT